MIYIFDVDGTLTPSREKINDEFFWWFDDFCGSNEVHLVTGSDYPKTAEQLGDYLCSKVRTVYNCSGNDVWQKGKRVKTTSFDAPKELYLLMEGWLQGSKFSTRTGNHIEERPGTINFSILGRNANPSQRADYVDYDNQYRERETIAHIINSEFDNITATVGGETGIDIYNTGCDKSQILLDFRPNDKIIFFGDRMDNHGNDYSLAQANKKGINHHVRNWRHTWEILKGMT